jgi:hypothetical protein
VGGIRAIVIRKKIKILTIAWIRNYNFIKTIKIIGIKGVLGARSRR